MWEAKLRQDLNSQVKLQKADDINITQGLAAPKYMQGDSGGEEGRRGGHLKHQSAFSSLLPDSISDKCLAALMGRLLNVESGWSTL